jgi:hypothetical protein
MRSPPPSRIMLDMNTERTLTSYLICLRGKLDPELASWFPELSLTDETDEETWLVGELPDQSALLGILFRIHNLNLQILSVEMQKETLNK